MAMCQIALEAKITNDFGSSEMNLPILGS